MGCIMPDDPEEAQAPSSDLLTPLPRLIPRVRPDAPKAATAEPAANLQSAVEHLVRALTKNGPASPGASGPLPEDTAALEKLGAKTGHRFQRAAGPDQRTPDPVTAGAGTGTTSFGRQPGISHAVAMAAARPPARGLAALRQHPFFLWVVVQVFAFGLILFGILLGSLGSGPAAPPGPTPAAALPNPAAAASDAVPDLTEDERGHALQTANMALGAENAGDLATAGRLFDSIDKPPVQLPGTDYQMALLALRRQDPQDADLHLAKSVQKGQSVPACCYVRAFLAGAKGDYNEAARQFNEATQAEPYNARYFFYWGEALRRAGKPQAAITCIRLALSRSVPPAEGELYEFKLRLAQLEAGGEDPLNGAIEDNLRQLQPTGDWLLLAGVENLQRGAFTAAADFLQRAAAALPAEAYETWVRDYAFQLYAGHKEVATLLKLPPGAGQPAGVPDATVLPLAEADPALWR